MKLLIIRHAESRGNATGEYSIAAADSLSPRGVHQARNLATSLKSMEFDRMIVSPLQRTIQTIAPYLSATDRRAELWPEIAEACWHDEREEVAECWRSQPASFSDSLDGLFMYRDNAAIRPAHPESFGEGLRRVHETALRLQEFADGPDQSLLMVTHGHFIREILNLMLEPRDYALFPHDNCGMTLLSFNNEWKLEFCNRTIMKHNTEKETERDK